MMEPRCKGLSDIHVHSVHSFDGKEKVADIAERADKLGLSVLCLTDHCEMNSENLSDVEDNILRSMEEIQTLRKSNQYHCMLLAGVESGQETQNSDEARRFLQSAPFDYIIGSLHNLAGEEDFYFLKYTDENAPQYLERYFDELAVLAEVGEFDALGHMTYPLRYMFLQLREMPNMQRYQEKADAILKSLVRRNKALEINTSGLRTPYNATYPGVEYLRRFRELGGEMVTLGSDAHTLDDVGAGLQVGAQIASEAGFERITYFVKRTPCFIPLREQLL